MPEASRIGQAKQIAVSTVAMQSEENSHQATREWNSGCRSFRCFPDCRNRQKLQVPRQASPAIWHIGWSEFTGKLYRAESDAELYREMRRFAPGASKQTAYWLELLAGWHESCRAGESIDALRAKNATNSSAISVTRF